MRDLDFACIALHDVCLGDLLNDHLSPDEKEYVTASSYSGYFSLNPYLCSPDGHISCGRAREAPRLAAVAASFRVP